MLKIRVRIADREIEIEVPAYNYSVQHGYTMEILKEVCEQIIKMNQ